MNTNITNTTYVLLTLALVTPPHAWAMLPDDNTQPFIELVDMGEDEENEEKEEKEDTDEEDEENPTRDQAGGDLGAAGRLACRLLPSSRSGVCCCLTVGLLVLVTLHKGLLSPEQIKSLLSSCAQAGNTDGGD